MILAGIALMAITEPAGTEGSDPSGGFADFSEDKRPYLWYGLISLVLGVVVVLVALTKMV
ncbi:MAG: hypothetical protein KGY68_05180 [Candidatus Thermoplasmatota archaeon]|nr:hypothetical protein [Candidatus Thermoplasmatota archaeon]